MRQNCFPKPHDISVCLIALKGLSQMEVKILKLRLTTPDLFEYLRTTIKSIKLPLKTVHDLLKELIQGKNQNKYRKRIECQTARKMKENIRKSEPKIQTDRQNITNRVSYRKSDKFSKKNSNTYSKTSSINSLCQNIKMIHVKKRQSHLTLLATKKKKYAYLSK